MYFTPIQPEYDKYARRALAEAERGNPLFLDKLALMGANYTEDILTPAYSTNRVLYSLITRMVNKQDKELYLDLVSLFVTAIHIGYQMGLDGALGYLDFVAVDQNGEQKWLRHPKT